MIVSVAELFAFDDTIRVAVARMLGLYLALCLALPLTLSLPAQQPAPASEPRSPAIEKPLYGIPSEFTFLFKTCA